MELTANMETKRFRVLSSHDRALVAVAVLLDGVDAANYLENDSANGMALKRGADELAELQPELRIPLVGTLLRTAVEELSHEVNSRR